LSHQSSIQPVLGAGRFAKGPAAASGCSPGIGSTQQRASDPGRKSRTVDTSLIFGSARPTGIWRDSGVFDTDRPTGKVIQLT
jgi:hypothetical protein